MHTLPFVYLSASIYSVVHKRKIDPQWAETYPHCLALFTQGSPRAKD